VQKAFTLFRTLGYERGIDMKRKRSKKLELNRETIQKLQKESLSAVAGGGGTSGLCPSAVGSCPAVSCYNCPDEH
jgi:hypothetical protein